VQLARVLGSVVATVKHESLTGVRLLLIQPQDENGVPDGDARKESEAVGVGERVDDNYFYSGVKASVDNWRDRRFHCDSLRCRCDGFGGILCNSGGRREHHFPREWHGYEWCGDTPNVLSSTEFSARARCIAG
jgi:microcompartment protein CcmK/EutM